MQVQKPKHGFKYVKTIFDIFEQIPEDWEVRSLSDFAKESSIRFSKNKQGPILSVTKYRGFVKSLDYFKKQIFSKDVAKYKMVEKGDFAYATIHLEEGSLGLLREFELGYISPMYTVFRIDSSVNPDYLYYLLKTDSYLQKYAAMGEGTVNRRKSISFESFSKLKIPLPILKEQQKIASILSNLDLLIQQTQKEIEQTQVLKKGLMQNLLTKGIGHTKFKNSKIGKIPVEWSVIELKNIVSSYRNGIYKPDEFYGNGFPSIRMFNIKDGIINKSDAPLLNVTTQELEDYGLLPDDILVNRVNSANLVGKAGIVKNDLGPATFESKNIRIRIFKEKCNPVFLNYFFNTHNYFKQINSFIKTAVAQVTVNQDDLNQLVIPLPMISEQSKIISIILDVDLNLLKKQEYKSNLENLKKGLMQKLLTGQIRVKI